MKNLIIALFLGFAFSGTPSQAQININVNLGSQPQWGPSGYDYVEYYYLPDIETYYYVPKKQFVYLNDGRWVFSSRLPSRYSGYNLYNGYKVVMNTPRPYLSFTNHKIKYGKYKGLKGQQKTLKSMPPGQTKKSSSNYSRDSREIKYSNGNSGGGNKSQGNGHGNGNKGKGKGKH
ncbi:MAG TPA: hypothetical protein VGD22_08495 [Sphingobacteriaceae bacterium]